MNFEIVFQQKDNQAITSFIEKNKNRTFVVQRQLRNVSGQIPSRTRDDIWLAISMCLLTTQQRSGPTSQISKFLFSEPFSLSLINCEQTKDLEKYIQNEIEGFGGIRFGLKIAKQLTQNFLLLQSGEWKRIEQYGDELEKQGKLIPSPDHFQLERNAALYMESTFSGFGPKQSRNFWQYLGLTRYEFVLDSRIIKWLRSVGFPLPLSSMALGEEEYYCFVSDILREWCIQLEILPCILDAAIFSSFDSEEWPEDASV
ncbi:MAG: hypothetical protein AB9897_05905 [Anaerolineaceae bacterium]